DNKTGMALYGFYRDRDPWDANDDGFSELAKIKNTTFGSRVFHRFGNRNKLSADFFTIKEDRRGGNRFDRPEHEADIAEAVRHNISTGALTFEQFVRDNDVWSVYVSGQHILRNSYYGAGQSLADYGETLGLTWMIGSQYLMRFDRSMLTLGIESREESLDDQKMGYPDWENALIENGSLIEIPHTENTRVALQKSSIMGGFAQYEMDFGSLDLSLGGRFDRYEISDLSGDSLKTKSGNVFSPRVTLKYEMIPEIQLRLSYSQGYRAPQIFDEDLHIETSGSRQVLHRNDPDLIQETSHSLIASADYHQQLGQILVGFTAEAFYTRLNDAFVNEYGEPDENGVVVYTRTNSEGGATVQGLNLEFNMIPGKNLSLKSGFTLQSSRYEQEQAFGEKRFFRTPDSYGFLTLDAKVLKNLALSSSATYTGVMQVPYFGPELENPDAGALRQTKPFFDLGIKVRYSVKVNGASLQFYAGVKNIFQSYQSDFDRGIDRDPGYIYGPSQPRTFYVGLKLGNMLY
ncbi:MAG TPA: TonB-dependent receptor, partial [Prolixibacteraceae bacterium]|nr:TonB-dependent receptor [Prolixibacteraceae bacterium]